MNEGAKNDEGAKYWSDEERGGIYVRVGMQMMILTQGMRVETTYVTLLKVEG